MCIYLKTSILQSDMQVQREYNGDMLLQTLMMFWNQTHLKVNAAC